MPTFKLGETIVRVYNPLPDVSEEDVVHACELEGLWPHPHGSAFPLQYLWSQGPEREEINILPGEHVELPVSIANAMYSELQGNGAVLIVKDAKTGEWPEMDSPNVRTRIFEALQKARQFYSMRGSIPIGKARARHSITTPEQWNSVKLKFKGNLINAAREGFLAAHMEKLRAMPASALPQKKVVVG